MNSVTSGLGSGIGFGIGHRLFGGPTAASSQEKETTLQPPKPMDACNEMKMRLFAMKEQVMYRDDQERYDRLFQVYEKLCVQN